ncbi:hypothetical protein FNH22_03535 [Fulvivirga sp. M361]|uniref:hypothetical protein n=1 Tax=Fulvivirga sp. M361 TaxID=2594266 RepID=UPI001179A15D|nr:hypothetical protein [Fulvivirga sp. M361]TRX61860.1 hypothetical protein FNH22_03535 [Fulvivirga sp. M361]
MKSTIFTLIIAFVIGLFTGCGQDDDPTTQAQTINGTWNLSNVSGGLTGINIDYNVGEVSWVFNENTKVLIIENNIESTGPEDIYAGLESGTYDYKIQHEDDHQVLYIDGAERGILKIEDNILKIDDGVAVDGFLTEFER